MNAESDSKIQRKKTVNLKNAMEQRPSPEMIWKMQRQNDLLKARIQELESASKVNQASLLQTTLRIWITMTATHNSFTQVQTPEHEKPDSQTLEDFKQQSQAQYQELMNDLYNLRRDLHDAEKLRDKVAIVSYLFLTVL